MESPFRAPELKLIETFGWDGNIYPRLSRHMARMAASAEALGFPFDPANFTRHLPANPGPAALRLRLTLDRAGQMAATASPLPANPPEWCVGLSPERLQSSDPRLAHKTTDRALYDRARATLPAGLDELIFLNERDEVCEGTISNLFFDLGHGLMTPPLQSGCLPGCLRAELLDSGQTQVATLPARDLPKARLWLGNSLRGLIPARMV